MKSFSVSVVIPAFNAQATIGQTIRALSGQTYPINEIIIVDDGSTDETSAVIRSFMNVKYIHQDNAGPAVARNRGAAESKSDIVFFTDSDCIPEKTWIERSIAHFEKPDVAVVAGSYGIANPESRLARCIHNEIIYRHHYLMPNYPRSFGSYNFGIRKDVFDAVGGFNTGYRHASGEDNDLSYKIIQAGHKIYFERESRVLHFHTEKIGKYLREQSRHGFWRMKMYLDHPKMMQGDGYTFWKDSLEVVLAVYSFIALPVGAIFLNGAAHALAVLLFLALLEIYFGFRMIKIKKDALFYVSVMFLRAFARTYGFLNGGVSYLINIYNKK